MKSHQHWAVVALFISGLIAGLYASDGNYVLYPVIAFCLALFLFKVFAEDHTQLPVVSKPEVFFPMVALPVLALLGTVLTPAPTRTYFEIFCPAILYLTLLPVAGLRIALTRKLLAIALLPAIVSAGHGIYQSVTTNSYAHAQFQDPNLLASFLFAAALLALGFGLELRQEGRRRTSVLLAAVVLLLFTGAALTMSRGAWLGLLGSLAVVSWMLAAKLKISKQKLAAVFVFFAVLASSALIGKFIKEHAQHQGLGASINSRVALLQATVHMIEDHPLTGVGFGLWADAYPRYRLPEDVDSAGTRAHNDYLESIAEGGPLGGLVYLAIPALWLVGLRRARSSARASWLMFGTAAASGVLALQAVVNFIFIQPGYCLFEGLLLGSLFVLSSNGATEVPKRRPLWKQGLLASSIPLILGLTCYAYVAELPLMALADVTSHEFQWFVRLLTEENMTRLASISPRSPGATFYLADRFQRAGDHATNDQDRAVFYKQAFNYYERARNAGGSYLPSIPFREALVVLSMPGGDQTKHKQQGEALFKQALAISPSYTLGVVTYGKFLVREGRTAEVTPLFHRAMQATSMVRRRQLEFLRTSVLQDGA